VVSRYVHLDSIVETLKPGDRVRAGQPIGRLGASGIVRSQPHLHFGLSLRDGDRESYVDPEPLLRRWPLVDGQRNVTVASLVNKPASAAVRR
jgi:murein DD-endopeptidase MepM/ murein hydrolase activator NlpD